MNKNLNARGKSFLAGYICCAVMMLFIAWLVIGGILLAKVTGPMAKLSVLKDDYVYSFEASPYNTDYHNEEYKEYNDYANSLINSEDNMVSWFFGMNSMVRVLIMLLCTAPYIILIYIIYEVVSGIKTQKKQKKMEAKYVTRRDLKRD